MTEAELVEILKAGEEALEYDSNCLCHDHTVGSVVDLVGRAVLHAAAEKIRSYGDPADEWAANLIDPEQQEKP